MLRQPKEAGVATDPMRKLTVAEKPPFLTTKERRQRIEKVLEFRKWTVYGWAQIMGVRPNQATRYLEADDPRISTIMLMANSLGCSASYLIDRDFTGRGLST